MSELPLPPQIPSSNKVTELIKKRKISSDQISSNYVDFRVISNLSIPNSQTPHLRRDSLSYMVSGKIDDGKFQIFIRSQKSVEIYIS